MVIKRAIIQYGIFFILSIPLTCIKPFEELKSFYNKYKKFKNHRSIIIHENYEILIYTARDNEYMGCISMIEIHLKNEYPYHYCKHKRNIEKTECIISLLEVKYTGS